MDAGNASSTLSPSPRTTPEIHWYGLLLIVIPTVTILGNLLVIVSVLRFKSLHSAINFLILGLAVADLFVALFVMPYAVYIYVQGGFWYLGPLMCDIYASADVACSTASILLLAVISFDRYRAVSRPIQYSRQAQNVRRVTLIIVVIWLISLALASPMVFGVNQRPDDYDHYECRFYNADFSIGSSIISFVIPCFVVLFVYIRIMLALRKRERAARMRRMANMNNHRPSSSTSKNMNDDSYDDGDEAGRIVAGPVVNMMMLALPSMTSRMRRFERHRHAIEDAGDLDVDDLDEDDDEFDEEEILDEDNEGGTTTTATERRRSRRSSSKRGEQSEVLQPKERQRNASPLAVAQMMLRNSHFCASSNPLPRRTLQEPGENANATAVVMLKNAISATTIVPQASPTPPRALMPRRFVLEAIGRSQEANDANASTVLPSAPPPPPPPPSTTSAHDECNRRPSTNDRDLGDSYTPHSSSGSLSENLHIITNDFVSEAPTTISRPSSENESSNSATAINKIVPEEKLLNDNCHSNKKKFKNLTRNYSHKQNRRSLTIPVDLDVPDSTRRRSSKSENTILPAFLRQFSMRSPKLFRNAPPSSNEISRLPVTINESSKDDCETPATVVQYDASEGATTSATETDTMSPETVRAATNSPVIANSMVQSECSHTSLTQSSPVDLIYSRTNTSLLSGSMTDFVVSSAYQHHPTLSARQSDAISMIDNEHDAFMAIEECDSLLLHNPMVSNAPLCCVETPDLSTPSSSTSMTIAAPTVTFSSTVHEVGDSGRTRIPKSLRAGSMDVGRMAGALVGPEPPPTIQNSIPRGRNVERVYPSLPAGIITCDFMPDSKNANAAVPRFSEIGISSSETTIGERERKESTLSGSGGVGGGDSIKRSQMKKSVGVSKSNGSSGGLAVRIVKRTINRKESSLKRKVSKAQRKEKRATKTLGIVVGIFLICWVPFFSMNILNAICIKLNTPQCEIGYSPFFYSTWIGYMNSFMNPIIYTIFNTEFRRAFKSLILGKARHARGIVAAPHRGNINV